MTRVIEYGPGIMYSTGIEETDDAIDLDVAVTLVRIGGEGETPTVATLKLNASESNTGDDHMIGVELTAEDCIVLARQLLAAASIEPTITPAVDQGVCPDGHQCVIVPLSQPRKTRRCVNDEYIGWALYDANYQLNAG